MADSDNPPKKQFESIDSSPAQTSAVENKADFLAGLRSQIGKSGKPRIARNPVNEPAIRSWCDAISESNPLYVGNSEAKADLSCEIVAPPAMLQVWTMPGLQMGRTPERSTEDEPSAKVYHLLNEAGFSGVVATNAAYRYIRRLSLGDLLTESQVVVEVSEEKSTRLGVGHFITTETVYSDQHGEPVGSMTFRILKFRPRTNREGPDAERKSLERPPRPQPASNISTSWFWEGCESKQLRIQMCNICNHLQHPPAVRCLSCGAKDLGYQVASGRGTLYSWAVPHYPEVSSFDYPLIVGLIELEEGIRLISNVTGLKSNQLKIGMPLELHWLRSDKGATLPQFRPAVPTRVESNRTLEELIVGSQLPPCPIPIDVLLVVSTALATRDFQDVHHNQEAAKAKGTQNIFMNILSTCGIVSRWIGNWAGPDVDWQSIDLRLGAPNYPDDTMTLTGWISDNETTDTHQQITVTFEGNNSLGTHVSGTASLAFHNQE